MIKWTIETDRNDKGEKRNTEIIKVDNRKTKKKVMRDKSTADKKYS